MTRAEEFQELRPLLFSIAYRILGSVSEAEDAVQETWLRCQASPAPPASAKAFLSATVTRISIDVLRSARVRREQYVGHWFPEPLLTDPCQDPERSAELAGSVSMAALLLLERLSPLERAVFVLREVFGFGFPEIASAVGRSQAACRQLAVRARRHTLTLDVLDGQIQTIRSVSNPGKLKHVGPVAGAWAAARELNQARRPTD